MELLDNFGYHKKEQLGVFEESLEKDSSKGE